MRADGMRADGRADEGAPLRLAGGRGVTWSPLLREDGDGSSTRGVGTRTAGTWSTATAWLGSSLGTASGRASVMQAGTGSAETTTRCVMYVQFNAECTFLTTLQKFRTRGGTSLAEPAHPSSQVPAVPLIPASGRRYKCPSLLPPLLPQPPLRTLPMTTTTSPIASCAQSAATSCAVNTRRSFWTTATRTPARLSKKYELSSSSISPPLCCLHDNLFNMAVLVATPWHPLPIAHGHGGPAQPCRLP